MFRVAAVGLVKHGPDIQAGNFQVQLFDLYSCLFNRSKYAH